MGQSIGPHDANHSQHGHQLRQKFQCGAQIPWDEEFTFPAARELFGSNLLVLTWIKGEPLPTECLFSGGRTGGGNVPVTPAESRGGRLDGHGAIYGTVVTG